MNFNFLESNILIYTFYILLVGISALATYGKTNRRNRVLFVLLVFLYCLIGGLRSRWVGSDTNNYLFYFDVVRDMSVADIFRDFASRDPISMIVFKYLSVPFSTYTPTLLIIHFLFCSLIAVTYYKYSDNCVLALFVFVFLRYHFFLMSGIRQGFALCIVLFSYKYLIRSQFTYFLLCVLFASAFHLSAIICLIIYPLRNIILYDKSYKLILVVLITLVFSVFVPRLAGMVFSSRIGYFDESEHLGNLFSFVTSFLIFGYVHIRIKHIQVTSEINTLYNIALLFFLFSILSFKIELAFREAMYFGFMVPMLITYLTDRRSLNNVIVVLMLSIYSITGVPISVDPYQFYWKEQMIEKTVK